MPRNDWNEYKRLILNKMNEDEKRWERMFDLMATLRTDVTGLKVKAAIFGGAAGVIGTALVTTIIGIMK